MSVDCIISSSDSSRRSEQKLTEGYAANNADNNPATAPAAEDEQHGLNLLAAAVIDQASKDQLAHSSRCLTPGSSTDDSGQPYSQGSEKRRRNSYGLLDTEDGGGSGAGGSETRDEAYWERRRRNNEAARRSREKRRHNDVIMESKLSALARENELLKSKLESIASSNLPIHQPPKLPPPADHHVIDHRPKPLIGQTKNSAFVAPTPAKSHPNLINCLNAPPLVSPSLSAALSIIAASENGGQSGYDAYGGRSFLGSPSSQYFSGRPQYGYDVSPARASLADIYSPRAPPEEPPKHRGGSKSRSNSAASRHSAAVAASFAADVAGGVKPPELRDASPSSRVADHPSLIAAYLSQQSSMVAEAKADSTTNASNEATPPYSVSPIDKVVGQAAPFDLSSGRRGSSKKPPKAPKCPKKPKNAAPGRSKGKGAAGRKSGVNADFVKTEPSFSAAVSQPSQATAPPPEPVFQQSLMPMVPPAIAAQIQREQLIGQILLFQQLAAASHNPYAAFAPQPPQQQQHGLGLLSSLASPPAAVVPSSSLPICRKPDFDLSIKDCLNSLAVDLRKQSPPETPSSTTHLSGQVFQLRQQGSQPAAPQAIVAPLRRSPESSGGGDSSNPRSRATTMGSSASKDVSPPDSFGSTSPELPPNATSRDRQRYVERRRRNNEAAKRCRANRRAMYEFRSRRTKELEEENQALKEEAVRLLAELQSLREEVTARQRRDGMLNGPPC